MPQQTEIDSEADERNIDPTELKQNVNRDKSGVREDRKRKEEKKRIDEETMKRRSKNACIYKIRNCYSYRAGREHPRTAPVVQF